MAEAPRAPADDEVDHGRLDALELIRILGTAAVAGAVWFRVWEPFPRLSLLGLLGTLIGGWPIFHEAWENIRERRMTMELSMTIALLAALAIGEFVTALMITTFVLAAEVLEGLTVGRGRRAIRDLLDFLPATATVRRHGTSVRIPLNEVGAGDAVLVSPGERIPVDGSVQGGDSYVDQATITGESTPIRKTSGSLVYAGTINQSGVLDILAERLGPDTSFGKIIEAVERAERSQAPVEKTADRYAGYLVYFALACAALTFALTRDARSTISVIIVAGACGIAAGTPLAILGAIGRAARTGAIIKGGRYLETLWRVDVVALDKTGTVTIGAPEVVELRPRSGVSERVLVETAAIAERRSEHPLAKAVLQRADALGIAPSEPAAFSYLPGRGIVAEASVGEILVGSRIFARDHAIAGCPTDDEEVSAAATEIVVARAGTCLGTILIADTIRPEARRAIQHLRRLGLQTLLLPEMSVQSATRWDAICKSIACMPNSSPNRKSRPFNSSAPRGRRSPWSAMASMTRRRWPRPRSAWRWDPVPTSRARAPTSSYSAMTCRNLRRRSKSPDVRTASFSSISSVHWLSMRSASHSQLSDYSIPSWRRSFTSRRN